MGLFTCCRSDNAVDEQAYAKSIVVAEEKARKGGNFDEDLQAVQWMRDRSLERSLERSLKEDGIGQEGLIQLKPPSFEAEQAIKSQQHHPEVRKQDSIEKTPKRRNNKKVGGDANDNIDDVNTSIEILEELLEESQQMEKMRILSHAEADAADRDAMQDRKLDKRKNRERRRKPDVEEPEELQRKSSSRRKSNKAATINAAATALKLDRSQQSSSSPDKRRKSKSSTGPVITPQSKSSTCPVITPQRESPSRKKQQTELELEYDLQVDSDVDSIARDQYLIAVQLLHRRMIQKQESLNPAEKEFLHNLLHQETDEEDEASLADRLSVIELTIEQLDSSKRLGAMPPPQSIGGDATTMLYPDPLTIPFNDEVGAVPEDLKSEVSVYSATSSHSGIGVETTLGGRRRRRSSRSKKRSKGEGTRLPFEDQLHTLRPKDMRGDDDDEEDEIGAPYPIIGASSTQSRLLKTRLMEALRGFLPYAVSEENFWLKFSLERDGASLHTLQHNLRASHYSLLVIQAKEDGHERLFGAFTSSPWRRKGSWFGTGQSFLFKKTDTLEVYPFTGSDDLVQYCSSQMLAIGGGNWSVDSPFSKHEKKGIGLLVDGDLQGGESYSCATFCNPKLSRRNEFSILNLEVWTLTPCMTALEAEKLEKHKLFVAQNSREATK